MGPARQAEELAGDSLLERLCAVAYPPQPSLPETLASLDPQPRCIELRLDTLIRGPGDPVPRWLPGLIEELAQARVKLVLTLREEDEGGQWRGPPEEKMLRLEELAHHGAWLVDLEARYPLLEEAASRISAAGPQVIVSHHIAGRTLGYPEIARLALAAVSRLEDSLIKIVHKCDGIASEAPCLAAVTAWRGRLACFSAWGPCLAARIAGPLLGAPLTYAGLDSRVVPGQPSYAEVVQVWSRIGVL